MPYPLCRHVKINGARCESPALTSQTMCYFHTKLHKRHRAFGKASAKPLSTHPDSPEANPETPPSPPLPELLDLEFPPLEDAESIQLAISLVVQAIALDHIEPTRARALLYALQLASSNARRVNLHCYSESIVRDVTQSESGEDLSA